jgi:hypothetical protein
MLKLDKLVESPVAWGTALALAITSLIPGLLWLRQSKKNQPKRTFSFTSLAMAIGSFPPRAKAPDAVINATILFQDCPTREDVVEMIIPRMLRYKRMATIPVALEGTSRPCKGGIDPWKLVRRIEIEGDDQELFAAVRHHMHDSLSRSDRELPWWEILIIDVRD